MHLKPGPPGDPWGPSNQSCVVSNLKRLQLPHFTAELPVFLKPRSVNLVAQMPICTCSILPLILQLPSIPGRQMVNMPYLGIYQTDDSGPPEGFSFRWRVLLATLRHSHHPSLYASVQNLCPSHCAVSLKATDVTPC